jgi:putative ABC transport system ATP-binding protein
MPILESRAIYKTYQQGCIKFDAICGVDVKFFAGEFAAVVGRSGSGKTTLLNILGGLDRPTAGEVWVDGRAANQMRAGELDALRRDHFGFVFQFFNLISVLTAYENVEYPLWQRKMSRAERKERVAEALALVGLENFARHRPDELSGGQQQRVAVARAIAGNPRVVFADEPTGNLDFHTGQELLCTLQELNRLKKITFIVVTHDSKIMDSATRQIEMRDGKINYEK